MAMAASRVTDRPTAHVATATLDESVTCGPLVYRGIVFALLFEAGAAVGLWAIYHLITSIL
jgi:hypothetical protein